jgi:carboxyl-terminal processing protease
MKKIKNKIIIFCFILSGIGLWAFVENNFTIAKSLDIYFTLFKELNYYYVDEINPEKLIKTSIDGMLESLDPYTSYIPESELDNFNFQITGQYGGIGALIRKNDDAAVISEPYENFPADKAGIKAGDILIKVEGKNVNNKNISEISDMLKGTPGTEVELEIRRPGIDKTLKKKIIREKITIPNVPFFGIICDSIGYIRLTGFTTDAGKDVKEAFLSLKKMNMKYFILDIRNNPGGLLNEAVYVSSIFIPKNRLVVSTKGKVKAACKDYYTENDPVDTTIPIAILANSGSASASEIVAGCLQDLDRAVIIGQRTFGKGLVQEKRPLSYNTQLKLTVAKYYIPSGRCIQALDYSHRNEDGSVGYIPDSLISEFRTKNGRKVYNGGGIKPDIKVDDENLSNLSLNLYAKNFIFNFATTFVQDHKFIAKPQYFRITDTIYSEFVEFLKNKDFDYTTRTEDNLNKLISSAKHEKYYSNAENEFEQLKVKLSHDKFKDLNSFKTEISELLKEEIVTRFYYERGRIEASLTDDNEVKKAVQLFNQKNEYNSILNGTMGDLAISSKSNEKQQ